MSTVTQENTPIPFKEKPSIVCGNAELQLLLEKAAAVSFDFFDTLFVRPLENPEDAFDILAQRLSIPDFRVRRRAAQAEAFRRMHGAGRKEIRLEDIYACLSDTERSSEELMQAEIDLELSLIEPNPEVIDLFLHVIGQSKTVVITSDMYFSSDFFVQALRLHGLAEVSLFISSDRNATKRDRGDLFDEVIAQLRLPAGDILHIGDNELADVTRPSEKGLMAFHYRDGCEFSGNKSASLSMSIARGLLRTRGRGIPMNSHCALGYLYGGPANLGFLKWIEDRAKLDGVDHVLFLSRDGYALERIARAQGGSSLPGFCYFLGSRTAYTLAAMNAENFCQFLPFLLSGSQGLAPCELLERIGVQPPAPHVLDQLGLGKDVCVSPRLHEKLYSFLYAYRWEILKVCRRNRHALYAYLRQNGILSGSTVALVDVGWSGTTQEAFQMAVSPLIELQVLGYYFCLADTPERCQRSQKQRMYAMVNSDATNSETIAAFYKNRVAIELLFSAPHHSVIGLQSGPNGVVPLFDAGRGNSGNLPKIAQEIGRGIDAFAGHYQELRGRMGLQLSALQIAWPLVELVTKDMGCVHDLLSQVKSFDAWGSSRNSDVGL